MALTSSAEKPQPLSVVVAALKTWVERCNQVWVRAQIVELSNRASGLQFLTLRDVTAEVSVSATATSRVLDVAGPLTAGSEVAALVRPVVWAKSGRLSFEVAEIRVVGEGQLLAEIERRKRLLQAEGLFDPARKLRLPYLPKGIGLICGAKSKAERDVLATITTRWPAAQVHVRHSLVQGPGAAAQVVQALKELHADDRVQVIIIARGGGTLEELLPFSDEHLLRAVAACTKPVVSAIGHEPDTPLLDLVADVRAATPTDAGKRVVPDANEELRQVAVEMGRARAAIGARITAARSEIAAFLERPVLKNLAGVLVGHYESIEQLQQRARLAHHNYLSTEAKTLAGQLAAARALSPEATLARGYAVLATVEGATIKGTSDVSAGQKALALVSDGRLKITIDRIEAK